MKKRILCAALVVMMLLGLMASFASAVVIVNSVALTVQAPSVGAAPSTAVTCGGTYAGSYSLWTGEDPVEWYDVNTGYYLGAGNQFSAGHTYRVIIWLECAMESGFALHSDDIAVTATVNGKTATVNKAYEQDPADTIEVTYDFTLPAADDGIKNAAVTVYEPIAGWHPDTQAFYASATTDYTIDSMVWYDVTAKAIMDPAADFFKTGKKYTARVLLKPAAGKSFGSPLSAKINGKTAIVAASGSNRVIQYAFIATAPSSYVCSGNSANCPAAQTSFTDVPPATNWAHASIDWAIANNITSGTTPTTFDPKLVCSRAQVVSFLWRIAGSPAPKSSVNPFTDVKSTDWFYNAVLWAVENKITSGTTPTTFSPNMSCSRSQVVTFLYYASSDRSISSSANPFIDVKDTDWFYTPVLWAVDKKITSGTTPTTFSPSLNCSREQIVTFLYYFAAI